MSGCTAPANVAHAAPDQRPCKCRHPDKNQGNEEEAGEHFKRVFEAHQRMLRDTDGSSEEEDEWDDDDYEAAMEEALAFFTFMWEPLSACLSDCIALQVISERIGSTATYLIGTRIRMFVERSARAGCRCRSSLLHVQEGKAPLLLEDGGTTCLMVFPVLQQDAALWWSAAGHQHPRHAGP